MVAQVGRTRLTAADVGGCGVRAPHGALPAGSPCGPWGHGGAVGSVTFAGRWLGRVCGVRRTTPPRPSGHAIPHPSPRSCLALAAAPAGDPRAGLAAAAAVLSETELAVVTTAEQRALT